MTPRFRAKRISDGTWAEGFYAYEGYDQMSFIMDPDTTEMEEAALIDPTTLQQFIAGEWRSDVDEYVKGLELQLDRINHTVIQLDDWASRNDIQLPIIIHKGDW